MNMSYIECRNMPVRYRRWYIDRLIKEFKKKTEAMQESRKSKGMVKGPRTFG